MLCGVLRLFPSNNVSVPFMGPFAESLLSQLQRATQKPLAYYTSPGGNPITVNIKLIVSSKDTARYYLLQNAVTIYDAKTGEKKGRTLHIWKKQSVHETL